MADALPVRLQVQLHKVLWVMSGDARPAVVLLSGGMDSATVLYWARARRVVPTALSFRYGQRHSAELQAARRLAQEVNCELVERILIWRNLVLRH